MTQEKLKSLLTYDPTTGHWSWIASGKVAGYLNHGYRNIMVEGKNYRGARLAFLYMTGSFPTKQVDHINRNRSDDRWENLRECDNSQNNQNKPSKNFCKIYNGTYVVYLDVKGKRIHIGTFKTEQEAFNKAKEAKQKYHGEFAN